MRSFMRWVPVAALALCCAACASITRGWNTQVQFQSEPVGANLRTSMGHQCVTPCTLQFSRKDEFSAVFSMPGYVSQQVSVKTRLAGAGAAGFAGNVVLGGVVGMGVDVASGASLEHCPNPVRVTLSRNSASLAGSRKPVTEGDSVVVYEPPECTSAPPLDAQPAGRAD